MYYDNQFQWSTVKAWSLAHPEEVQRLIKADEALSTVTDPVVDTSDYLDPAKVADAVKANAEVIAIANGPLSQAMAQGRQVIASNGVKAAKAATKHYRNQLAKPFDKAAKVYAEAVAKLPAEFSSEDVVTWDAETFAAYKAAAEAHGVISHAQSWLGSLSILSNQDQHYPAVFLVADPEDPTTYAEALAASKTRAPQDKALASINPVLAQLVRAGATIRMATPEERDAQCSEHEAQLSEAQAVQGRKATALLW